jgi:hypothetical protein
MSGPTGPSGGCAERMALAFALAAFLALAFALVALVAAFR